MELEAAFICGAGGYLSSEDTTESVCRSANGVCPSAISPRAAQTRTIQTTGSYNGHQCKPIRSPSKQPYTFAGSDQ